MNRHSAEWSLHDIAAYTGRSYSRVSAWTSTSEWRRSVRIVGTQERGAFLYDSGDVVALLGEWVWLPPATTIPAGQLLSQRDIAAYAGFSYDQVRADVSQGRLGPSEATNPKRWRRQTVDDSYRGRQKRSRK